MNKNRQRRPPDCQIPATPTNSDILPRAFRLVWHDARLAARLNPPFNMGWDGDLLADADAVDQLLLCGICFDVMKDAVQCTNQHAACTQCLRRVTSCPTCRCPLARMNLPASSDNWLKN